MSAPRTPRDARGAVAGLARVRGESMRPALNPGDLLLVRYRRRPRIGEVVVARLADGAVVVKRAVAWREGGGGGGGPAGWWLLSDDPDRGVDSRHRGAVPEADVFGVAVARLWPRPRRLRRREASGRGDAGPSRV